jgi:hypothetical protein
MLVFIINIYIFVLYWSLSILLNWYYHEILCCFAIAIVAPVLSRHGDGIFSFLVKARNGIGNAAINFYVDNTTSQQRKKLAAGLKN